MRHVPPARGGYILDRISPLGDPMQFRIALFALLLVSPWATSAAAPIKATLKQGAPGCMTEALLVQFLNAASKNDVATGTYLLHDSCVILKQDIPVLILNLVGDKMEVEADDGGPKLDMWVPAKYVEQ